MRQTKKDIPQSPADRWKDRFHRKVFHNNLFYENFSIYVSRPTFDLLRRSDEKGRETYSQVKDVLDTLLNETHKDYQPWDYVGIKDENDFVICTKNPSLVEDGQPITLVSGPYDVKEEMKNCRKALLIHVDFDIEIDSISSSTSKKISRIQSDPIYTLNSQDNNVNQDLVKRLVGNDNLQIMDYISFDLSAARLLPTDLILDEDESEQNFRRILLQQFNEIRLIDDVTQVNYEQILAVNRFDFNKSPMQNLSGRPGTGKSTIQHILVCETLLQTGDSRGKRKLLYMATTKRLLDEAKEEIKSILQLVYTRSYNQASKDIENIHFITEEDLYINNIGKYQRIGEGSIRGVLDQIKSNEYIPRGKKSRWKYWLEQGHEGELVRILNNFIYGVFGSPSKYLNWLGKTSEDDAIIKKFTSPINLISPGLETTSNIQPIYFWNPLLTSKSEQKRKSGCARIRDLQSFLSDEDGLQQYLHDADLGIDGIWNQSGRIFASSLEIEKLQQPYKEFDSSNLPNTWKIATEDGGFDAIFVDESQDFSVVTYSILLRFFSNRKRTDTFARKPFAFIATGDEYQTIRGSLFQGNMLHINTMYEDWKKYLISISNDSRWTLADGLQNPSRNSLIANYRNFDTAVAVINNIVEKMYDVGRSAMPNLRRAVKSNRADVERKGLITSIFDDASNGEVYNNWELIIDQLIEQQKTVGRGEECDVKVALVLPLDKIKSENNVFDNLEKLCKNVSSDLEKKIRNLIGKLREMQKDTDLYSLSDWFDRISDVGIFDIEGIKGLTVPVVLTFYEPLENYNDEWELMQNLSYILVAVSRPQFGLFIHTKTIEDFGTLTKIPSCQKNTIPAPEGDASEGFAQFLKNSTTPATPLSKLLVLALTAAYSNIKWKRLNDKAKTIATPETKEFLHYLSKIFIFMKLNYIAGDTYETGVVQNIEQLQRILSDESSRSQIEVELNGEYITRKNSKHETISTLEFFIQLNLLSRIAISDGVEDGLFEKLFNSSRNLWDQKLNLLNDDGSFAKNQLSSTLQTYNWLDLFFSNKKKSENMLMKLNHFKDNPWSNNEIKRIYSSEFPDNTRLPRINVSPWNFPKPIDANFREPWMEEESYWTLPPKLFEYIIEETEDFSPFVKKKLNWLVKVSEREPENIVRWVSDNTLASDLVPLNWLIGVLCFDEGKSKSANLKTKILRELAKEVAESAEFSSHLTSLVMKYETKNDLEEFLDLIDKINTDRMLSEEIKSNFNSNLNTKKILVHWGEKYSSSKELTKIPVKILNLMKTNYPSDNVGESIEQINHLIQLNNDGSNRIIENVTAIRKTSFTGEKSDSWERDFASGRKLLNKILEIILENGSQNLINLCFEDKKNTGTWGRENVLKTVDLINWLSSDKAFNLSKVTNQVITPISRDGLEKVLSGIIFDGLETESIFNSYHSKRAQIAHGKKQWYEKDDWQWNWRAGGHNFWNTTGYERGFATKIVIDRFYNPRDSFDPQLYTNDQTLMGLIIANNFKNSENLNKENLEKMIKLFLSGGAELLAQESIILHQLVVNNQTSIHSLVNAFAKFLRVKPSIYTSHLNGEETKIKDLAPTINEIWGTGIKEVSKFLPSTLTDNLFSSMTSEEKEKMSELDGDLGHYATYGNFTNEKLDVKNFVNFTKNLSKSLTKYFKQMNYYHELLVLSSILENADFPKTMASQDAIDLLDTLLDETYEVNTYTNSPNLFGDISSGAITISKNTYLRYEIEGHQIVTNVSFKNKKFNSIISLLRDLISCWRDDDRMDKATEILSKYFGEKSILNLSGFNNQSEKKFEIKEKQYLSPKKSKLQSMFEMYDSLSDEEQKEFRNRILNQEEE